MTEPKQIDKELINKLVVNVIKRLLPQLGADGSRGSLVMICTGCCGEVDRAVDQMRNLIMKSFKINLLFSKTAQQSYQEKVILGLNGFPQISLLDSTRWIEAMNEAEAVIAPLASLNTVSRLAMLMADSDHTQLMLNAMTMGKPLIIARGGLPPYCRTETTPNRAAVTASAKLQAAIGERLRTIESYGGVSCEITDLCRTLEFSLGEKGKDISETAQSAGVVQVSTEVGTSVKATRHLSEKIITASHIRYAAHGGFDLTYDNGGIITPMARDLAVTTGVSLKKL